MPPIPVDSTTLSAVAYDAYQQLLQLEFRDHSIYRYFNIPPKIHERLMRAPSKGQYFNNAIRGRFPFVQASLK